MIEQTVLGPTGEQLVVLQLCETTSVLDVQRDLEKQFGMSRYRFRLIFGTSITADEHSLQDLPRTATLIRLEYVQDDDAPRRLKAAVESLELSQVEAVLREPVAPRTESPFAARAQEDALRRAVALGFSDGIRILCEAGASVEDGADLHLALCSGSNVEVIQALIDSGAPVNLPFGADGRAPLEIVLAQTHAPELY